MTNEKMERQLAAALEKTAPDDMSGVLSRCEKRKGTVITMTTKKTTKKLDDAGGGLPLRWCCWAAEGYSISRHTRWRPWFRWT